MAEARLCVVVGATGSIGSAVVRRLRARDLDVLAVARTQDALDALAEELPGVRTCVADVGDDAAAQTIAGAVDAPVRMAIFAAGLPVRGSVDTIEPSMLAVGADIKLGGLLRLVRAVRDRLETGSRIVAFAGSLGLEPRVDEFHVEGRAATVRVLEQLDLRPGMRVLDVGSGLGGPSRYAAKTYDVAVTGIDLT